MGLIYFDGKSWSEITREERFFCSHLFHLVKSNGEKDFIQFLNHKFNCQIDETYNWEMAYEVCFYRDLWQHRNKIGELFSRKRTFDLCLFSDKTIIVVEAKSYQNFDRGQITCFKKDILQIKKETDVEKVFLVGLVSSKYRVPKDVSNSFKDLIINWKELSIHYDDDPILNRADVIYENDVHISYGQNNLGGCMSGIELVNSYKKNEEFMVGRRGGIGGKALADDISTGKWRTRKYETNRERFQLNDNWFKLSEFMHLLDE